MARKIGRVVSIAKGWEAYAALMLADATADERERQRIAFYAGAAVLWESIMNHALDDGEKETPGDLERMAILQREIDGFQETFDALAAKKAPAPTAAAMRYALSKEQSELIRRIAVAGAALSHDQVKGDDLDYLCVKGLATIGRVKGRAVVNLTPSGEALALIIGSRN